MEEKENPCRNCDSTSMEMCLLIRHCNHWVERNINNSGTNEIGKRGEK